jgi:hypothetical protein
LLLLFSCSSYPYIVGLFRPSRLHSLCSPSL